MPTMESRRHFLTQLGIAGVAGLGGLCGAPVGSLAAEPPPEITTVRFEKDPFTCLAPQAFEELLHAEGITDIRYININDEYIRRAKAAAMLPIPDMIAHGDVDFARAYAVSWIISMD